MVVGFVVAVLLREISPNLHEVPGSAPLLKEAGALSGYLSVCVVACSTMDGRN